MGMSSDSGEENISRWESLRSPLLIQFECDRGSLGAFGAVVEFSDEWLILSLSLDDLKKGRLKIPLAEVSIETESPHFIAAEHLASPFLDRVILKFPRGGFCQLTEMPRERERWPDLLSDLIH